MVMQEKTFYELAAYIKEKFGISLGREKKTLLEGRLVKILARLGLDSAEAYYAYLRQDTSGLADADLINAVSTNHTFFMRETDHFQYFSETVLPHWYERIRDADLRTWCAACSTGQEAYTLAMLISDFFSLKEQDWDTTLLATDISAAALAAARRGVYESRTAAQLPERWRKLYFQRLDSARLQIIPRLRQEIVFRQFNLITPRFPFKRKFHAIFCRNVMIYFDKETRRALVNHFYQALEPGGYLFIGHSEVLEREETQFEYLRPSIYRKGERI